MTDKTTQHSPEGMAKGYRLGVTWTDLTVRVPSAGACLSDNVLTQFNVAQKIKESRGIKPLRTILHDSHGCVMPGEMLLVLGRPGSGCTTLLSILANQRASFSEIGGSVFYGSMDWKEASYYPGQIVMNREEEIFFPTLTVGRTMDFATRMKVQPNTSTENRALRRDEILSSLGIGHTQSTKVGDEYVRGVSGGERKRVSIAETLTTDASVYCWDNSTRGLDASTALEFMQVLREKTDSLGLTTIVTLYQAGNGIFNLFDKVLVLDEGKQIYYGPRWNALPFMTELGFWCDQTANIGDFLTGVTSPNERRIISGYEDCFPRAASGILSTYMRSTVKHLACEEYSFPQSERALRDTELFQQRIRSEKRGFRLLSRRSPYTVGFLDQLLGNITRQCQVLWGDKPTFFIRQALALIQSLVAGSLFFSARDDSSGLFVKSGVLYFTVLFPSLVAMSETTDNFFARPVLSKHKLFAFHHPAVFCLAQIVIDIPVLLLLVTMFSLVMYFMVGLQVDASNFFIYFFMMFSVAMAVTALFRLCGAAFSSFQAASKASGLVITMITTYAGYVIPKPDMHPWFVWIYWINPLAYGLETLNVNEFQGTYIACAGNNLVPTGQFYDNPAHQACMGIRGEKTDNIALTGEQYLTSLSYKKENLWRNFGVVWAWWALYVLLIVLFSTRWKSSANSGKPLVIPREKANCVLGSITLDEEAQGTTDCIGSGGDGTPVTRTGAVSENEKGSLPTSSVFTWKNLTYIVKTTAGERVLLDNVYGYVKPGMLGALMGTSGAGKTTLMDVLAQRKVDGTIKGSVLVNGRPLPLSFQRSAGYCEQLDIHDRMSTVREALEFAAILRQPREVSRKDKLKYVDMIIDLLELHDIEHTLIGSVGNGLSIEQRKRVTIGVELVSKPDILIFFDEPTSGLDGQAAFRTVQFLRRLADLGQAILVTIHQPSAPLFAFFDTLLLLQRGGRMVYFGDVGDDAEAVKNYFAKHGAPCPDQANIAEHMINVVSDGRDWHQIWLESSEHNDALAKLEDIIDGALSQFSEIEDDGREFAAPLWEQTKTLTRRMSIALYRDTEYINNRAYLHLYSALFNGFTYWMIGNRASDLQLRLFTIFCFIFLAPGVFAQLQPLFLERRDIYEKRERKSKTYHWAALVSSLIVAEIPYLLLCGVLYWACWYYTVGFPKDSAKSGATLLVMLVYQFMYTGIGQFVAAYAPNAVSAMLINPIIIGTMVSFCGVVAPYEQITAFWRYWLYWLDPLTYMVGGMLVFSTWGSPVQCAPDEFAIFDPQPGTTCVEYLDQYLRESAVGAGVNLTNPDATSGCRVCQYRDGSDYLRMLNLRDSSYGWRGTGICVLFVLSSYALVFLLMRLRTKATKRAE